MLQQVEAFKWNEKVAGLINHALIAAMTVCLAITLVQLAARVVPGWSGAHLPWLAALASIEGMYSWRLLRRKSDLEVYDAVYVVLEWIVLAIFIKGYLFILGANDAITEVMAWTQDFGTSFFNGEYLFALLIASTAWIISGSFARDLAELEGEEAVFQGKEIEQFPSDRGTTNRRIMARVFTIGIVMVFITAVVYLDMAAIWKDRPLPRGGTLNVVVYFLLALTLLSQTHMARLRWLWAWEQVPITPTLTRRWATYGLVFLAGAALVAFVLPTRYTLGLLSTLHLLLSFLLSILSFLIYILIAPLIMLFGWLMSLFSSGKSVETPPPPEMPTITAAQAGQTGNPWLDFIKSLLFWVVLFAIVGYAFYQYIRQNKELLARLKHLPGASLLSTLWNWVKGWLFGVRKIGLAVQAQIRRLMPKIRPSLATGPVNFLSLRRLSPRQKVLFFYLALVRRGGEAGLPRRPNQTPTEYAQTLHVALPEDLSVQEDLGSMTQAFQEARYSHHDVNEEHAGLVRRIWNRLRRVIRGGSKQLMG